MKNLYRFFILSLVCLLSFSCGQGDDECRFEQYIAMQVGIYTERVDAEADSTWIQSLAIDSLTIQGLNIDSLLINGKGISTTELFLNKLARQSDFVFSFIDKKEKTEIKDTISLFYDTQEDFISFECGIATSFTLSDKIETTHHFIDSIRIIKPEINTTITENVQIFHTPE